MLHTDKTIYRKQSVKMHIRRQLWPLRLYRWLVLLVQTRAEHVQGREQNLKITEKLDLLLKTTSPLNKPED